MAEAIALQRCLEKTDFTRPQKRASTEKLLTMQLGLQEFPIGSCGLGFQFDAKPLQGLIESPDCFLFVDALVALEAL
ncbi:MAG TPA: hypothetical protein VKR59_00005, partial [Terriglobales bacterium]|nr:hypothetical protein [Terriglobales bacterium]